MKRATCHKLTWLSQDPVSHLLFKLWGTNLLACSSYEVLMYCVLWECDVLKKSFVLSEKGHMSQVDLTQSGPCFTPFSVTIKIWWCFSFTEIPFLTWYHQTSRYPMVLSPWPVKMEEDGWKALLCWSDCLVNILEESPSMGNLMLKKLGPVKLWRTSKTWIFTCLPALRSGKGKKKL